MKLLKSLLISIKNDYTGAALNSQLREFFSSFLHQLKIFKLWRRFVVAIPKPMKPKGDPNSYQPISLLYVERLIYARLEPIIDPLVFREHAEPPYFKSFH